MQNIKLINTILNYLNYPSEKDVNSFLKENNISIQQWSEAIEFLESNRYITKTGSNFYRVTETGRPELENFNNKRNTNEDHLISDNKAIVKFIEDLSIKDLLLIFRTLPLKKVVYILLVILSLCSAIWGLGLEFASTNIFKQKFLNNRGLHIVDVANECALSDIEYRSDSIHTLPPSKLYSLARREIVISAITAFRSFDQNTSDFIRALENKVALKVMILDTNSREINEVSEKEKRLISEQIKQVINIIKQKGLNKYNNFSLRFCSRLNTFTSVMIDGNIDSDFAKNEVLNPLIRIQPLLRYLSHHKGVVFQFSADESNPNSPFELYASELREQWKASKKADLN